MKMQMVINLDSFVFRSDHWIRLTCGQPELICALWENVDWKMLSMSCSSVDGGMAT